MPNENSQLVTGPDAVQIFRSIGKAAFGRNYIVSDSVLLAPFGAEESDPSNEETLEIQLPNAESLGLTDIRASIDYKGVSPSPFTPVGPWVPITITKMEFLRESNPNAVSIITGETDLVNLLDPRIIRSSFPKFENIKEKSKLEIDVKNVDPDFWHRLNITHIFFETSDKWE